MKIKRIAIVGGGTAGWLAANHLGRELHDDTDVEITVIESDEIPIIGVGEGTVPSIKASLRKFGISELDLLLSCETTFKTGIKFSGWLDPRRHGADHHYYHPFSSPFPDGLDLTPSWLIQGNGQDYQDVSMAAKLSEAGRCPKHVESPPYEGELEYAYHVNAHQFARLLARNARTRFGVKHLIGTIVGADRGDAGQITALRMKTGTSLSFDFYIDCSGFASILTQQTLRVPFVDKSHQVLTDTALVQQVPFDATATIPPYTLAQAHAAGWIWDIPVLQRRGTGFVYSSRHMTEAEAVRAFAAYIGRSEADFQPRKIRMQIGFREQFWTSNCVALGLAQGFVEPLEATSILLTDFTAGLLAKNFPREQADQAKLRPHFNQLSRDAWERVIDFVQMHYHLSDRNDSDFWRDSRYGTHLSDLLRERLEMWRVRPPLASDFPSRFEMFNVENFLYVLYGMKFCTRGFPVAAAELASSSTQLRRVMAHAQDLLADLMRHEDWLRELHAAAAAEQAH
ncbi:MAG: tryptophan halogenase family protein, partial [Rubrivivax sp.]